jgi:hypothetical protein
VAGGGDDLEVAESVAVGERFDHDRRCRECVAVVPVDQDRVRERFGDELGLVAVVEVVPRGATVPDDVRRLGLEPGAGIDEQVP